MKFLLYLVLLITASNCGSSQQVNTPETSTAPEAQTDLNDDILVGNIDRQDLTQAPHVKWFDPVYQSYTPNEKALKTIQENINNYEIKMFMGTWCADSQYEVPRFYKLLDLSDYNMENLEITAVREDKTLPDDAQKEFDVIYVPTIIFFKDGREVGRFVEYAREELEIDIAKIVSGQKYRHSYQ